MCLPLERTVAAKYTVKSLSSDGLTIYLNYPLLHQTSSMGEKPT